MTEQLVARKTRLQRIKEKYVAKNYRPLGRGFERGDRVAAYRPGVKLCLERARLYTESYRQTEGEPTIIRRAKALAHILESMTIYIQDDELLVGDYASSPSHLTWHPEYSYRWLLRAVNDGYRGLLDDKGREELAQIAEYWVGKSVQGRERSYFSEDLKPYWEYRGAALFGHYNESGVPHYEKIFKVGLNGLLKEAEEKLVSIADEPDMPGMEYLEQKDFLEAVIISLKAAIGWAGRYAELAREQVNSEDKVDRKKELETIAEVCEWIPGNPPRTFHEALQTFWFIHVITHIIEAYDQGIGARLDQVLHPFYRKDMDEGRITREDTKELLELLWVKCAGIGFLFAPTIGGGAAQGTVVQQTLTLGGVTPDGQDAVNELTYLILDSRDDVGLSEPTTAIRIHNGTSREFLLRVTKSLVKRSGTVSLFNDDIVVRRLTRCGIPLEDARNYGIEQCMRWTIPGKNLTYRTMDGGSIMLPKCLELALNRGVDPRTGQQYGAETPDPLSFISVEDILDAFAAQVAFFAEKHGRMAKITDAMYERYLPRPFLSALLDGGIQKGKDCRTWCYYPKGIVGLLGNVNVANALAAVKKLVFEEKSVSIEDLLDALSQNWEGKEELRQTIINKVPKYGNDDDYVDAIAKEVAVRATREVEKVTNHYGYAFEVDGSSGASYFAYSDMTGATPDGRKNGDLYSDGTISPAAGTDTRGPTAVLKSVSRVDPLESWNHLLNQKFFPQHLQGDNAEKFVSYLEAWRDLGIHHIQFNILDRETLLDAQKNPEKHPHLVVRVAGYAAYFIDLSPGVQDEIICRTEQALA